MDFALGLSSFPLMSSEVGNDWKAIEYMVVSYGEIFFRINVLITAIAHRWKIFQIQPKKNVTKHGTSMKNNLKAFMLMTGKNMNVMILKTWHILDDEKFFRGLIKKKRDNMILYCKYIQGRKWSFGLYCMEKTLI